MKKITKRERKYPRVQFNFIRPSMTKQSFKDEVDINNIMAKFQKTGAIKHFAKHAPTYGDATPIELMDAQNIIANSSSMFEELPSSIRKRFDNDPVKFLAFVQDEKNTDEMVKLGLKIQPQALQEPVDETEKEASLGHEKPEKTPSGGKDQKSTTIEIKS